MFNGAGLSFGQFDEPLNEYKSVVVTRSLFDFYTLDPKLGLYGGGGMDMRFELLPINFALNALPPDAPRWGAEFKALIAHNFTRSVYAFGHCTSLPVETNSISLDPEVKDAWGMPVVRITYRDHPEDLKTEEFFRQRGLELLEAAGARKKWSFPPQEQQFGVHLLGTCRMGNDPKTSVINTDHRTHDVPNLFLCDGSSLVTGGRGQPTMTIQALAFRAADRIIALARRGELKSPAA
jgi:choline dehydrogenase-like flavoprotein